jgi:hypothetical protein
MQSAEYKGRLRELLELNLGPRGPIVNGRALRWSVSKARVRRRQWVFGRTSKDAPRN